MYLCDKTQSANLSYTQVYEYFNLTFSRSIFGHTIHMSSHDWKILNHYNSAAVHCPTSNLFLGSGLFNLEAALRHGGLDQRIGLGSDVGAGTSLSPFQTLGGAYKVAMLQGGMLRSILPNGVFPHHGTYGNLDGSEVFVGPDGKPEPAWTKTLPAPESGLRPSGVAISAAKGFYMATLGTARALSLDNVLGNFDPGKEADFVAIGMGPSAAPQEPCSSSPRARPRLCGLGRNGVSKRGERCLHQVPQLGPSRQGRHPRPPPVAHAAGRQPQCPLHLCDGQASARASLKVGAR